MASNGTASANGHAREVLTDLEHVVNADPKSITVEDLKQAESLAAAMHRALAPATAGGPHPELEQELQSEFAKLKPKIEEGTVTKDEADYLHSLEARAHGYTERGGITAHAQSVVSRRERRESLSHPGNAPTSTGGSVNVIGGANNGQGLNPAEQSHQTKVANFEHAAEQVKPKIESHNVTADDANLLHSREQRAFGHTERGGIAAQAQSMVNQNENDTPNTAGTGASGNNSSTGNNTSAGNNDVDSAQQSHQAKVDNFQQVVAEVKPKMKQSPEAVTKEDANLLHSREQRAHGITEQGGIAAQAQSLVDRNTNTNNPTAGTNGSAGSSASTGNNASSGNNTSADGTNNSTGNTSTPATGNTGSANSQQSKEANFREAAAEMQPTLQHNPDAVTKEDGERMHDLEQQAHGFIPKGGVTAHTQSLGNRNAAGEGPTGSDAANTAAQPQKEAEFQQAAAAIEPKLEQNPEAVTKDDGEHMRQLEQEAHGYVQKGGVAAHAQSLGNDNEAYGASQPEKETKFQHEATVMEQKVEQNPEFVTQADGERMRQVEEHAHGAVPKGGVTAHAQSLGDQNAATHGPGAQGT